jgi:hypothetical protein
MRWAGHVASMQERTTTCIVKENSKNWRPIGRPRLTPEYNIKTDLKETLREGVDRFHVSQGRTQYRSPLDTALLKGLEWSSLVLFLLLLEIESDEPLLSPAVIDTVGLTSILFYFILFYNVN